MLCTEHSTVAAHQQMPAAATAALVTPTPLVHPQPQMRNLLRVPAVARLIADIAAAAAAAVALLV
jgi:hypothetical protein